MAELTVDNVLAAMSSIRKEMEEQKVRDSDYRLCLTRT